jgi:hypothetical protein
MIPVRISHDMEGSCSVGSWPLVMPLQAVGTLEPSNC